MHILRDVLVKIKKGSKFLIEKKTTKQSNSCLER
jgi:hypothetical protein